MGEASPFGELWERARRGDRDAQADLYLEYGPHLRRIIRLKLRDLKIEWAVDPDDLLDSFFIRLYNGRAKISINDALHFTNYCEQALRNRCIRVLRSVIVRLATRIEDCPPELFEDLRARKNIEQMGWEEQLERAYSRLTHHERMICWLAADGHSWSEIGRRLNISGGAARKAHERAEARVRNELLAGGGNSAVIIPALLDDIETQVVPRTKRRLAAIVLRRLADRPTAIHTAYRHWQCRKGS